LKDGMGNPRWVTADLTDLSETGIGISLMTPLQVGSTVVVRGNFGAVRTDARLKAQVNWCSEGINSKFSAGLEFLDGRPSSGNGHPSTVLADPEELDCYEVLQLNPNADIETISRVYRLLAQRYHPDNTQTGSSEVFVRVSEAYRILSDPEQRASYDARHRETKRLHWRIFDQARAATVPEAEKRKRQGILGLLYAKAAHDPERAHMTIHAFEDLLGCPREHLQAALWYLKGKGYIQRSDNGRYSITVQGFDEAEERCLQLPGTQLQLPQPEVKSPADE
jgi:DnaJ-like protein/PilZ domain-containing protein